jgi:hypothetical protein
MARITKRLVDSLRPKKATGSDLDATKVGYAGGAFKKDVVAWDDELRGFGVRFKPTGAGAYIIQYRNAEGRSKRLTLGSVAELTAEEARRSARTKLSSVAQGFDPVAEKHATRTAPTVSEICDWYLEKAESGELRDRHPSLLDQFDRLKLELSTEYPALHGDLRSGEKPYLGVH